MASWNQWRKRVQRAAEAAKKARGAALPGAMARTPAAPAAGALRAEIGGMQAEGMSEKAGTRMLEVAGGNRTMGEALPYLLPHEAEKAVARAPNIEAMNRMLDFLPKAKELAAVMKAGGAKRGWYRASAQAILDTFGPDDAPRFASLLAAMSPQTSVEMNLENALRTWKNWTAAGRPTDEAAINAIMGRSVAGTKGEDSVLDAWRGNALRALQASDPSKIVLSGPKVDSFMGNLADDVYRVTNDAWNANLLGVSQTAFSGSMPKGSLLDPGLTPGYLATNARMRQAADIAGFSPAEGQETAWSFAMQLYEKARETGMSVVDLLKSGQATDALVRGAPDFSTLFQSPRYASILEEAGLGGNVAKMTPHQWPDLSHNIMERLSPDEQKDVMRAAERLDALANQRRRESYSRSFWNQEEPGTIPLFSTAEMTPYAASGHLGPLNEQTSGRLAQSFTNPAQRDIFHEALGLPGIEQRKARGVWNPPEGGLETNPSYASGVQVDLTKGGDLRAADRAKLDAAEAMRGYMTGQGGSAYSGMQPAAGGAGVYLPREGKMSDEMATTLAGMGERGGFFTADTGAGVNLLPSGERIGDQAFNDIRRTLSREMTPEGQAPYTALPEMRRANPVGGYIDYADAWRAEPGSGAVARQMLGYVDQLPGNQQRSLSEAAMGVAGDVMDKTLKAATRNNLPVRDDLINALKILREQGIDGLREALKRGDYIASLAPLLMPYGGLAPERTV